MKCHGCGVEKDETVLEVYPYPEDHITQSKPIKPFMQLDCEGMDANDDDSGVVKSVTVCHNCFHRLQPDMWISQRCWEALNPVVPFDDLPDIGPWEALPQIDGVKGKETKLTYCGQPVVHLLAWDRIAGMVAVVLKDPASQTHGLAVMSANSLTCDPPCDLNAVQSPLYNSPVIVYPDGDVIPRGTKD